MEPTGAHVGNNFSDIKLIDKDCVNLKRGCMRKAKNKRTKVLIKENGDTGDMDSRLN